MKEYLTLGPTPYEEDCAQVGSPDYLTRATKECRAYRNQLLRILGEPPHGASLTIKRFAHDFGSYHEVCVVYDPMANHEAMEWAFKADDSVPARWDDTAKQELNHELP